MEEEGEVQHDVGEDHLLAFTARSSADETWANAPGRLKEIVKKKLQYRFWTAKCKTDECGNAGQMITASTCRLDAGASLLSAPRQPPRPPWSARLSCEQLMRDCNWTWGRHYWFFSQSLRCQRVDNPELRLRSQQFPCWGEDGWYS